MSHKVGLSNAITSIFKIIRKDFFLGGGEFAETSNLKHCEARRHDRANPVAVGHEHDVW